MSHTVKITTTTTSNSNAIILNSGYLKTVPGLLKLGELILGIISVGIVAYYYTNGYNVYFKGDLFFFLMATTFMICTFCLLLSCLISWSTGGLISKTMFELIYHAVATILLLASSVNFLVKINNHVWKNTVHEAYMAASIIGLINTILYLLSAIFAQRQYRGI
ncbi:uncharacterized protein LOC119069153 [Bradysia coprophila]|uniref:uncharacterized protein LOC119069153 n=1 Tax=Bradysia coprophila TaxID=38358 RepID=UPI00187DA1F3|nr:uncharacterized protein LOC119069153 [Bradysia coprophila]